MFHTLLTQVEVTFKKKMKNKCHKFLRIRKHYQRSTNVTENNPRKGRERTLMPRKAMLEHELPTWSWKYKLTVRARHQTAMPPNSEKATQSFRSYLTALPSGE